METHCSATDKPIENCPPQNSKLKKIGSNDEQLFPRARRIQIASDDEMSEKKCTSPIAKPKLKLDPPPPIDERRRSRRTRQITKKRVLDICSSTRLMELKRCNSKETLRFILLKLSPESKKKIKFYMSRCFIQDLFTRRLKNKMFLLSKRELLYRAIENPDLLTMDCHFDNNLLKNYCTGIANFLLKHKDKLAVILKRRINRKTR